MEEKENINNSTEEISEEKEIKKVKKPKKDPAATRIKDELEKAKDQLLRTAAEFDNYKKRTDRERAGIAEYAKCEIIKKILPILDNIDRAQSADRESEDYIKGIEMIIKQFSSLSESLGIEEIGAAGEQFDPNLHEAVMHIADEAFGENEIAEVLQKGYKLGDTIIRAAMVKVAN
ncbi:MAG: nucleotide exchange factor GrpE [Clostridia bacterium]|nr:nucleotide exchange factor GrpE [Clostridia bacterium]